MQFRSVQNANRNQLPGMMSFNIVQSPPWRLPRLPVVKKDNLFGDSSSHGNGEMVVLI